MTDPTAADGESFALILYCLSIVRSFPRRNHGMGAAVAGGAVHAAMAGGIPVKRGSCIDLGDAAMAGGAI